MDVKELALQSEKEIIEAKKIIEAKETIEADLQGLEEVLIIADENGLFHKLYEKDGDPTFDDIFKRIQIGFQILTKDVDNKKIIAARAQHDLAFNQLYRKMNHTRWRWRFSYSYGGPMFLYFFGIFALLLFLWASYSNVMSTYQILLVPAWAYLWGAVGGILQGVWRLWHDLETQSLRRHLLSWYFILPFMGAILGAIAYLIFFAGFIVATGATQIENEFFVVLLSALAGFSSKWMVMLLLAVAKLIKPEEERQGRTSRRSV